jgi:hypothetical protein
MATLSTSNLNWLANEWEKLYSSAVLSGIVGDLAHKRRGGYHISRQDQPSTNYSVSRPDDKLGPSDRASAIDMTMSTADMIKCHKRLRACFQNRAKDPRTKYINAWNGWDGQGDAGRYDVVTGNVGTATPDHKGHIHLEIRRRYVNDRKAMEAILSMLKGEPYVAPTAPKPTVPADNNGDEWDMDKETFNEWMDEYFAQKTDANGYITSKIGRDALNQYIPQGDTDTKRPAWWVLSDVRRLLVEIKNLLVARDTPPDPNTIKNVPR